MRQIQAALGAHQPVVEIVSPQPDSVLPAGPWTLRLRVHDWPLVDAGALGLGPHLVVQLDQEPPRIWTTSEGEMPELSPGSHRVSVYAALPWGEARKNPGAVQQIRLHRTAPNPPSLPAPGSPQLLSVSPAGASGPEPLLLDWLLLDAPLQGVGGSGTQWRLRVSINGDALLLDQQASLWLRGWRPGLNTLRLELLDARGEPLNPPFNSLVQEVDLSGTAAPPRWRDGPLSAEELAILLGETPPSPQVEQGVPAEAQVETSPPAGGAEPTSSAAVGTTRQATEATSDPEATPEPTVEAMPAAPPRAARGERAPAGPAAPPPAEPLASDLATDAVEIVPAATTAPTALSSPLASDATNQAEERDEASQDLAKGAVDSPPNTAPATTAETSAGASSPEPLTTGAPAAAATETVPPAAGPADSETRSGTAAAPLTPSPPSMTTASAAAPQDPGPMSAPPSSQPPPPAIAAAVPLPSSGGEERLRPTTSLTGRARDLVNDDGTLRRPERRGPLAALRERLQP